MLAPLIVYRVWGRLLFSTITSVWILAHHLFIKVIVNAYHVNHHVLLVQVLDQLHVLHVILMTLLEDTYYKVRDALPAVIVGIILIQTLTHVLNVFHPVRPAHPKQSVTVVYNHQRNRICWGQPAILFVLHFIMEMEINASNVQLDVRVVIQILANLVSKII